MLLTVGLAIDIEVSKRSELGGDLAQAVPLSLLGLARCSRLASATTSGRASIVRLPALDLAVGPLAVPGGFQLLHQPRTRP
jgi:hypothetical protein